MDCWGGDVSSGTDSCSLNHVSSTVVWGLSGGLWVIAVVVCLNALRNVQRTKPIQKKYEPKVLFAVFFCSAALSILGFVKASGPESRLIGEDLLVTLLFSIGTSLLFAFIQTNPINPAGTGITLFALQRKRRLFKAYTTIFPFLIVCTSVAAFLPMIGVAHEGSSLSLLEIVIPITFAVFAAGLTFSISVQLYVVRAMRNDFKVALRVKKHEVSEAQKKGIELVVESTGKVDAGIGICAGFASLVCILISIRVESVMTSCWVLIPLLLLVGWVWIVRYAIISRQTTVKVIQRRQSRGFSLNHQQGNSITITTSSSNQLLPPHRRQQFMLIPPHQLSPVISSSPSRPLSLKKTPKSSSAKRFLTRVEEAENEGTIISKYDVGEWANNNNNIAAPPTPSVSGQHQ